MATVYLLCGLPASGQDDAREGVCVLGPSLEGLQLADDPDAVRRLYGVPPRWDGLGIIPFRVVPHFRTPGHPETEMCERLAEYYVAHGIDHRTLRDGQAIVVDGATTEIVLGDGGATHRLEDRWARSASAPEASGRPTRGPGATSPLRVERPLEP